MGGFKIFRETKLRFTQNLDLSVCCLGEESVQDPVRKKEEKNLIATTVAWHG